MRNWILFILVIFLGLFFTCMPEPQKTIEKEVIRIVTETDNSGQTGYGLVNAVVYPIAPATAFNFNVKPNFKMPTFSTSAFASHDVDTIPVDEITKANDFLLAKFYWDISFYSTDPVYGGVWRILDLSANTGAKACRVTLYIKVIEAGEGGVDEQASFAFRTPNASFPPKTATQKLGDTLYYAVELTTNELGQVEWCYTGSNAYDNKTALGEPDYHDYEWLVCEIWLYEYWKSEVVPVAYLYNDNNRIPLAYQINNLVLRSSIVCGFIWKRKNINSDNEINI